MHFSNHTCIKSGKNKNKKKNKNKNKDKTNKEAENKAAEENKTVQESVLKKRLFDVVEGDEDDGEWQIVKPKHKKHKPKKNEKIEVKSKDKSIERDEIDVDKQIDDDQPLVKKEENEEDYA